MAYVACVWETRNSYKILDSKPQGRNTLWGPMLPSDDSI
jgi:hypothetical protein